MPVRGTDGERAAFRRRLGKTLTAFRLAYRESQEALGEWLDVNVETVGRWERGEREPKAYELHRLAHRYGIEAGWLLDPTDSVTELDARADALRRAASEAARADVEAELVRRGVDGRRPRRDTSPA